MNKKKTQVATLPVEPFGTKSPSKFSISLFWPKTDCRTDLVDILKLKLITIIVAGR